jgi:hypothetical protein
VKRSEPRQNAEPEHLRAAWYKQGLVEELIITDRHEEVV